MNKKLVLQKKFNLRRARIYQRSVIVSMGILVFVPPLTLGVTIFLMKLQHVVTKQTCNQSVLN